jgi:hypothetical protein
VDQRDYNYDELQSTAFRDCFIAAEKYIGSAVHPDLVVMTSFQGQYDPRDLPDHHACLIGPTDVDRKLIGSVQGLGSRAPSFV